MSGSNGAGKPGGLLGKSPGQPGYDSVIAQLKRQQSREEEPSTIEPAASNASSEDPVRLPPEAAGRALRLRNVKAELARVQEELDDTTSMRQEAEEMDEPELLEECLATENRLQALVAELTAEISRLQKPAGSEALRERLRRIKEGEARARTLLGSEGSTSAASTVGNLGIHTAQRSLGVESELREPHAAAPPRPLATTEAGPAPLQAGLAKQLPLQDAEGAREADAGARDGGGHSSAGQDKTLKPTGVPGTGLHDAHIKVHHVKDAAPLEAPESASQAGPGLADLIPTPEAETEGQAEREGADSEDVGGGDKNGGESPGLVASTVSRIAAGLSSEAASVMPAGVVGGGTSEEEEEEEASGPPNVEQARGPVEDKEATRSSAEEKDATGSSSPSGEAFGKGAGSTRLEEATSNGTDLPAAATDSLPAARHAAAAPVPEAVTEAAEYKDLGEQPTAKEGDPSGGVVSAKPAESDTKRAEEESTAPSKEQQKSCVRWAGGDAELIAATAFEDVEHVPETASVAATAGSAVSDSAFAGSDVASVAAASEPDSQPATLASLPTWKAPPSTQSSRGDSLPASVSADEPAQVHKGINGAAKQIEAPGLSEPAAAEKGWDEIHGGFKTFGPTESNAEALEISDAARGVELNEGDYGRSISLRDGLLAKQQLPQPGQGHQRRSSDGTGGLERGTSNSWEAFDTSPQTLQQDLQASELKPQQAASDAWEAKAFAAPGKASAPVPATQQASKPPPSFEESSFPAQAASASRSAGQSPNARSVSQMGNPFQDFFNAGGIVPFEHDRSLTASPALSNPFSSPEQLVNESAWPQQWPPSSRGGTPDPFDALGTQPSPQAMKENLGADAVTGPASSAAGTRAADSSKAASAGGGEMGELAFFPPAQPVQPAFEPEFPPPQPSQQESAGAAKKASSSAGLDASRGFDDLAFPDAFAAKRAVKPQIGQPAATGTPAAAAEPPWEAPRSRPDPASDLSSKQFGDLAFPSSAAPLPGQAATSSPGQSASGKMPLFKPEASFTEPSPSAPAVTRSAEAFAPASVLPDPFRAGADGMPAFAPEQASRGLPHGKHAQPTTVHDPFHPGGPDFHVTHSMVIPEADWEAAFAPAKAKPQQLPISSQPGLSKQPSIPARQPPPPPTAPPPSSSAGPANGGSPPATVSSTSAAAAPGSIRKGEVAYPQVFAPGSANSVQKLSEAFTAAKGQEAAEEKLDPAVWVPMSEHDRTRCEQAFTTKFRGSQDGVGLGEARELYSRADLKDPFADIFRLSDMDADGRLRFPEFLLFMYLLKALRRGATLPKRLSPAQVSHLLGKDLGVLSKPAGAAAATSAAHQAPAGQAGSQAGSGAAKPGVSRELAMLLEQGYTEEDAKRALFLHGNDLELASNWLAERTPKGGQSRNGPSLRAAMTAESPTTSGPPSPVVGTGPSSFPAASRGSRGIEGDRLAVRVEKAALSYKKAVDRPLFTLTLRDAWGNPLEPLHDTPPCQFDRSSGTILAEHTVKLDTPVGNIPEGSVVYLELKHWKAAEKKWSTLGWTFAPAEAFLDGARVRTGPLHLHMYHKPVDTRAHFRSQTQRKLKALSAQHDLHVRISGSA